MSAKRNPRFEPGDRVRHEFFGDGTFDTQGFFIDGYAMVTWDKRPPRQYNMGENPCMVKVSELTGIASASPSSRARAKAEPAS